MMIVAKVLQESPVRLWGLSSTERLRRQLREIGGVRFLAASESLPERPPPSSSGDTQVLLLNGHYLFEIRTLKGLLGHSESILFSPADGRPAAALVPAGRSDEVAAWLLGDEGIPPAGLKSITTGDLQVFDPRLRSAQPPILEPVSAERRVALESLLYGNAYRGITDLVTKFVWPRPARWLVGICARAGLSPNAVTTIGLLLVLAACYAFLEGQYAAGLAAGWVMTLLDTVDGKLARVTIQSSPFGHLYDHAIDLIHPPFWYILWGMSLDDLQPVMGLDLNAMCWVLVLAYVLGRVFEVLFGLLGNCDIFTWRPFDAWFRLITARRNPCLIILTASLVIGRPDWGFIAVVAWMALTTAVLMFRLLQGIVARTRGGPLRSWLSTEGVAKGPYAASFRVFGGTRGAYRS